MSLQTVELSSVEITFDKGKTKEYRTDFNKPCDCQNCRNYYKHIEENKKLVEFLSEFGIDYNCTEEVFSWDLGNDEDSLIHHEGIIVFSVKSKSYLINNKDNPRFLTSSFSYTNDKKSTSFEVLFLSIAKAMVYHQR